MEILSPDAFCIRETNGWPSASDIRDVFEKRIAAILAHNVLDAMKSRALLRAFIECPATRARRDGVPGLVLGAYHYSKSFDEYLADLEINNTAVASVLAEADDPVSELLGRMGQALAPQVVRPARWHGVQAALVRGLSWSGKSEYILLPHEDGGQLADARQIEFEAAQVVGDVMAANLYPSVPPGGGELRIWNVIPSPIDRNRFGTSGTGYPYPATALTWFNYLDVAPTRGCLILMNGSLMHAVHGYPNGVRPGDHRLILNFFSGALADGSVVHWV